jgi:pimeloyl-ACP methyl ester carboxylesterase
VVLLHGFRGDHHGLAPLAAHLPGLRVTVPDLPGFGASPPLPRDRHDVAGYAAWARDLLAAVAPDGDAVLAGHSFGALLAAATLALPEPPAVRGLVLVSPVTPPVLAEPARLPARGTALLHRVAGRLPERVGTGLLRHRLLTRAASVLMVTTRDRDLRRWIHREHDRYFATFADRRTLLEAFAASTTGSVAEAAAHVAVPTLIVAGDRDDLATPADQRALRAAFPDARLVPVPGVGHLTHYETPGPVAAEIARFVAERRR